GVLRAGILVVAHNRNGLAEAGDRVARVARAGVAVVAIRGRAADALASGAEIPPGAGGAVVARGAVRQRRVLAETGRRVARFDRARVAVAAVDRLAGALTGEAFVLPRAGVAVGAGRAVAERKMDAQPVQRIAGVL